MNLKESLTQTRTQRASLPAANQTADLRKMLGAKSGKAGATTGPAVSNVQEQAAAANAAAQATQQQKQAQLDVGKDQLQATAQDQQMVQAQQQLQQKQSELTQNFVNKKTEIADRLDEASKNLKLDKNKASLAQSIFERRLADNEYTYELEKQGNLKRLEDSQNFELESAKTAFGNWKELFEDESEFAEIARADDKEFARKMANMNADHALSMVMKDIESENTQAKWKSYGDFVGAGAEGYSKYKDS